MSKLIHTLLLILIPFFGFAGEWDEAFIDSLFSHRQLDPIEGVWQFTKGGAKIAIKKSKSTAFEIYLLDSPVLEAKPGTLIGNATKTPKNNYYDVELKSKVFGKHDKLSSQTMTFTINDNGTLTIKPYKNGFSLSFRRWLSYLTRLTLIDNRNRRPTDIDGAVRVYPYNVTDHLPICL